jgi:hypothetical protein
MLQQVADAVLHGAHTQSNQIYAAGESKGREQFWRENRGGDAPEFQRIGLEGQGDERGEVAELGVDAADQVCLLNHQVSIGQQHHVRIPNHKRHGITCRDMRDRLVRLVC